VATTRDIRVATVAALATIDGLVASGLIFINKQQPASTLHRSYTVLASQSKNTKKYRDRDLVRVAHTVQVQLSHVVRPKDQIDSLDTALDDGDRVVQTVMTNPGLEMIARVMYVGTARALASTGDYIYSQITFDVESDAPLY